MASDSGSQIAGAADLIRKARHAVALTGAGISTPSGIPDFRSPGSGLWTKADPRVVASIDGFRNNPRAYYEWRRPLMQSLRLAQPNAAHRALADLEQRGLLLAVITQNIDGLHQAAGSRRVLEVHGRARELICLDCGHVYRESNRFLKILEKGEVPYCLACGGLLKPNVVLFGEVLPEDVLAEVKREVRECDLMIVAGSSLEVQPACSWPHDAMRGGANAIVINLGDTHFDECASLVIHADVATVLPAILEALDS